MGCSATATQHSTESTPSNHKEWCSFFPPRVFQALTMASSSSSSSTTSNYIRFFSQFLPQKTNRLSRSNRKNSLKNSSKDSSQRQNQQLHHGPGSSSTINEVQSPVQILSGGHQQPMHQNLPLMKANASSGTVNESAGITILNQNTQNLGVLSTSNSISPQPLLQSPVDGNPGTSILNHSTQNLGLPSTSNNILPSRLFQNPVDQSPSENRPAPQNPIKSSAAVGRNSEENDDLSLYCILAEGSNRASRYERIPITIPQPRKSQINISVSFFEGSK